MPDTALGGYDFKDVLKTELVISLILGGGMALWVFRNRKNYTSSLLYWPSQVFSAALFLMPLLFFVAMVIGIVMFKIDP